MTIKERIIKKILDIIAIRKRDSICENMRKRLINKNPTIISSNCTGGILSHDLGIQFNSPTINMYFEPCGFIKFVNNLKKYLSIIPTDDIELTNTKGYPVCLLEDIRIYCVHYKNGDEVREAWKRRSARVDFDNLFVIMTDRNGFTADLLAEFAKIPYKKVLFSSKKYEYDFVVYIEEFKDLNEVRQLQFIADFSGRRYYEKYFDFVSWLNDK